MTQSDILLKHLSTVFDPELGANIVELGMVKAVDHEGSTVKIDPCFNNCRLSDAKSN